MERRNSKTIWIIATVVVAALLGVVAYVLTMNRQTASTTTTNTTQQKTTEQQPEAPAADATQGSQAVTITFTDEGFATKNYTVSAGKEVKVENNSSMQLQFSSDDHPTHTEETELNLAVLAPGESASFTPTKVGAWSFHDHLHDQYTGVLTVTE